MPTVRGDSASSEPYAVYENEGTGRLAQATGAVWVGEADALEAGEDCTRLNLKTRPGVEAHRTRRVAGAHQAVDWGDERQDAGWGAPSGLDLRVEAHGEGVAGLPTHGSGHEERAARLSDDLAGHGRHVLAVNDSLAARHRCAKVRIGRRSTARGVVGKQDAHGCLRDNRDAHAGRIIGGYDRAVRRRTRERAQEWRDPSVSFDTRQSFPRVRIGTLLVVAVKMVVFNTWGLPK